MALERRREPHDAALAADAADLNRLLPHHARRLPRHAVSAVRLAECDLPNLRQPEPRRREVLRGVRSRSSR
jgi:hypothetical protein